MLFYYSQNAPKKKIDYANTHLKSFTQIDTHLDLRKALGIPK